MPTSNSFSSITCRNARGFSLLELMITLTLLGIMIMLAVPGFEAISNVNRLSGTSNELLTSMQVARMEAIRRNARVVICRSANPESGAAATCNTGAGNWDGWIAFVDDGGATPANARNGTRDAGETVLRVAAVTAPLLVVPSVAVSGASQRIVFRPDGLARTPANVLLVAQLRICIDTTSPAQNARDVSIATGSRMVVVKATAAACAAPADS
ncbi:MAG: GspH/FimT family pseudopilin [Arenimonas sp.]